MILLRLWYCAASSIANGIVEDVMVIVGAKRRGSMGEVWWTKR